MKVKCSLPQTTNFTEQIFWELSHYYVSGFFAQEFSNLHACTVYSGQLNEQPSLGNTLQSHSYSFRHHPFNTKSLLSRSIQRLNSPYSKIDVTLLNMVETAKAETMDAGAFFLSFLFRTYFLFGWGFLSDIYFWAWKSKIRFICWEGGFKK